MRCFTDAGFPPGAVNLIVGRAATITPLIMDDRRVAKVSFTGSVPIGRQIVEQSARTLKKVTMELGADRCLIKFPKPGVFARIIADAAAGAPASAA